MSVGENIRNYSVKKKLRALVGVAIVYTLIITIANMVFLSIMENRSMKLYTGPYKTSQIVAYLNVEMQKLNTYAYKYCKGDRNNNEYDSGINPAIRRM